MPNLKGRILRSTPSEHRVLDAEPQSSADILVSILDNHKPKKKRKDDPHGYGITSTDLMNMAMGVTPPPQER